MTAECERDGSALVDAILSLPTLEKRVKALETETRNLRAIVEEYVGHHAWPASA